MQKKTRLYHSYDKWYKYNIIIVMINDPNNIYIVWYTNRDDTICQRSSDPFI